MPEELLERTQVDEVQIAPQEDLLPPAPPEGLDTVLYENDERGDVWVTYQDPSYLAALHQVTDRAEAELREALRARPADAVRRR